jgi:hypothetical protein
MSHVGLDLRPKRLDFHLADAEGTVVERGRAGSRTLMGFGAE